MRLRVILTIMLAIAATTTSAASEKKLMPDDVARVVRTIIQTVMTDWKYSTLEPMLHPLVRSENRFRTPLETGRSLGQVKSCPEGRTDPLEGVPKAIQYSATCIFEHGRAKIYLGFGVAKDGSPVVLGLDIYPIPESK